MCGTDLQAALPRLDDDAVRIGVTVLAALFSPLMGAAPAAYFAYDADRDGRTATRNLMIALLGFSLVGLVAYMQLWGGLYFGI